MAGLKVTQSSKLCSIYGMFNKNIAFSVSTAPKAGKIFKCTSNTLESSMVNDASRVLIIQQP